MQERLGYKNEGIRRKKVPIYLSDGIKVIAVLKTNENGSIEEKIQKIFVKKLHKF